MRKFFIVLVATVSLLLMVSLVGCEKVDEDPYIPTTNTDSATTQITIEDGNVVVRGESDFFEATIRYIFEEGVYSYTLSETYYLDEASSEKAYEEALATTGNQEVTLEEQVVSFRADETYIYEGMGVETAASYLSETVMF